MDPFSSLDAFLNDSGPSEGIPVEDHQPNTSFDDFMLDLPKKTKKVKAPKNDSEEVVESKKAEFVPVRGQKTAFNKIKKIKDSLAVTDQYAKLVNKQLEQEAKRTARGSRRKRTPQRRNRRSYSEPDSDDEAFESNNRGAESNNRGSRPGAHGMPAFVNLDSDDEYADNPILINRNLASDSAALQTSENDEVKVVVKFGFKLDEYMLRPFQKLSELIAKVAAHKSLKAETIFLMLNGKIVSSTETLKSIDYIPGLVISAHVAEKNANANHSKANAAKPRDKDEIELRVQSALRKQPFAVHIRKSDLISNLVFQCAEEFKCDPKKIRLEFDGDLLNSDKTAEDHELEGGEMIDMFISK